MESSVNVPQSGFPSPPQILITNLKTSFIVISFMVNTKYRVISEDGHSRISSVYFWIKSI